LAKGAADRTTLFFLINFLCSSFSIEKLSILSKLIGMASYLNTLSICMASSGPTPLPGTSVATNFF